jgi:hypothetical protein
MTEKTTKRPNSSLPREGRYEWRDAKTGKFVGVEIVRPAKGPSNTSIAEIRRAIDKSNAARKTK